MKEKGFTLIELLAVIVILSVITLITIPMITNVIEESKKKALASSIQGLVESANLYAIENDGVYEFLFDKEHKGSKKKGESLDYRGAIDGEGKLYLDREGNVSVCISNDTYYAYKNYNSGIMVGERKTGNCIIGFDALTNKYVAMLDNGTGNVSNIYSKDEVNNLVDEKTTELNNKITSNINEITSMKSNIEELQNNLNNYALQSELNKTNTNMENLSSLVNNNQVNINDLNSKLNIMKTTFVNYNDVHGIENGGKVSVKVNVPVTGTYLVVFGVAQCGADQTPISDPYWIVNGNNVVRTYLNIPISKSWDNLNTATNIVYNMSAGETEFIFTNATGVTTSTTYGSTFMVYGILIS